MELSLLEKHFGFLGLLLIILKDIFLIIVSALEELLKLRFY